MGSVNCSTRFCTVPCRGDRLNKSPLSSRLHDDLCVSTVRQTLSQHPSIPCALMNASRVGCSRSFVTISVRSEAMQVTY